MRIATWNIERLKHYKDLDKILEECKRIDADILVLTETDERVKPDYPYYYRTPMLLEIKPDYYGKMENRVSIFSKYPCVARYDTYDSYTSISVELETDRGGLVIYGTIIGIFGNREKSFNTDLIKQMEDIRKLSAAGKNICILGDYNCTFCDNYYYTKFAREQINNTFQDCKLSILTEGRTECIDHIAVSDAFVDGAEVSISEWNLDKKWSDHKGIVTEVRWRSDGN